MNTLQKIESYLSTAFEPKSSNDIKMHMLDKHRISRDATAKALYTLFQQKNSKIEKVSDKDHPGIVFFKMKDQPDAKDEIIQVSEEPKTIDEPVLEEPKTIELTTEIKSMSQEINNTLAERANRYGEFKIHADITQGIKEVMYEQPGWKILTNDKREALEMIAHKIGRIINGDPEYHDSWHDIEGYARLVSKTLEQK